MTIKIGEYTRDYTVNINVNVLIRRLQTLFFILVTFLNVVGVFLKF